MDYKQKYEEALERASKYYNANTNKGYREIFEDIFHEFKESEDERIRKALIERFKWELKGAEEQDAAGCSRQKDIEMFKQGIAWLEKQGEQKPTWSEEDEKLLNSAISLVYEVGDINLHSWLKSIKDRVRPQSKQEWSKEDSERLDRIYKFIWANRKGDTDEVYQQEQDAEWLMTLNPQPKQVWSEEDENMLLSIINDSEQGALLDKEQINCLKSIKSNYWKPSEEQMKWLKDVIETVPMTCRQQLPLESLYNDLKKSLI